MLFLSGFLLSYTAVIVPVQICLWNYDDPCNIFPTLFFDVIVDSFFLVMRQEAHSCTCALRESWKLGLWQSFSNLQHYRFSHCPRYSRAQTPSSSSELLLLLLKPFRPAHLNRCVIPSLIRLKKKLMQVEAFIQFFLGYYAHDMTYQDDLVVSVKRNLSSLSGFWFDCVTSIPWSYMDLYFYLVIFQPAPSLCSHCLLHYSKKN